MNEIRGLPAHVLLVHALVIIVPTAALMLVVSAWWRRGRVWLGFATIAASLASLVLVPITTNAGQWLRDRVGNTPLVARHADLGDGLLPWVIGLFVMSVVVTVVHHERRRGLHPAVRVVAGLLATAVAVGSAVQTVRIGESGSKAVWENNFGQSGP